MRDFNDQKQHPKLHFEVEAGHLAADIWRVDADGAKEHNFWAGPHIKMTAAATLLPPDWANMEQDNSFIPRDHIVPQHQCMLPPPCAALLWSLFSARSGWTGLWATWPSWRCPWLLSGGWTRWPLKVPSNPNYSTILWISECKTVEFNFQMLKDNMTWGAQLRFLNICTW